MEQLKGGEGAGKRGARGVAFGIIRGTGCGVGYGINGNGKGSIQIGFGCGKAGEQGGIGFHGRFRWWLSVEAFNV